MAGPLDDLFATQSTTEPAAPAAPGPLDDLFGPRQQPAAPVAPMTGGDYWKGLARSIGQGATFGFGDEAEAYIKARLGGDYDSEVQRIRGEQKEFEKAHPIASTAAEVGGAVPTSFIPGMGGLNLARATGQGALAVAKASGRLGATQGFGSGLGKGEGDIRTWEGATNRGMNALTHGALGYPFGAAGGVAMHGIAKGLGNTVQLGSDILREGSDAGANAIRAANRGAHGDGTDAARMLAAVLPQHKTVPQDRMALILSQYGEGIERGLTEDQARQTATQAAIAHAQAAGRPLNPSTASRQVGLIVERYNEMHRVPLQLHELPATRQGSGGTESSWTMRAAANRASPEADAFRDSLRTRQEGMGDELLGIIEQRLGGSQGDDMMLAARERLRNTMRGSYKAAEDADEAARAAAGMAPGTPPPGGGNLPAVIPGVRPIDLSKEISTMHLRHQGREGATSKGMVAAVEALTETSPRGPTTMRQWLDVKQRLDDMIEDSKKAATVPGGPERPTDLTRQLTIFKKELMDAVSKANPLFAKADAEAAKGFNELRVADLARKIGLRINSQTRSALRELRAAPEEAKDMARIMYAQNLADTIANKGMTHDLSKMFASKGSREIMTEMLGPKAAKAVLEHIDRIAIASRSHQNMGGSQTAPLLQRFKDADLGEKIRQMMSFMNPMGAVRGIGEYAARTINAKRDAELLKLYGTSTDQPHKLIDALQRMQAQQNNMKLLPGPVRDPSPYVTPFAAITGQRIND